MSTPLGRRAVAALVSVSTLWVGLVGAQAAAAPTTTRAAASVTTSTQSSSTVLTPAVTPLSSAEIANPMRGQYRWMGYASQPGGWPAPDLYYRDQVYWGRLEPTKGVFDFSALDTGVAGAGSVKGKFGFRVMAYCPYCWMESRSDWPKVVPSWMPVQPGTSIPDWNSEVFLSEWENLMRALGARYGKDLRLGYVDVGGFGKYGEWMPAGTDITETNALRLIAAVAKAFPSKHVLLSGVPIYTKPTVVQKALAAHTNLGLRSDCLGQTGMQVPTAAFADVWKTRPFFTEWCIGGDPVLGRDQVKTHHVSTTSSQNMKLTYDQMTSTQKAAYETAVKTAGYRYAVTRATVGAVRSGQQFRVDLTVNNAGSAPTYDPWTVRFVLKDSSGKRVATLPLSVDLRKQLPGTTTTTSYLTAPTLATGVYGAFVEAVDPSGYSVPMRWANGSRDATGAYPLGQVGVGVEVPTVTRLAGPDRYSTSAAISAATFGAGVPVAYVATGGNFPDALSGAPAAGVNGGPVLLVTPSAIPTAVQKELTRLAPKRIVILGGTAGVSDTVKARLDAYTAGTVTRLAGSDRYSTSAVISAATFGAGVPVAYVATGGNFPDALSGAPAAGVNGGPVLLVTPSAIPTAVQKELTRLAPKRIVILGGTGNVSDTVRARLDAYTAGTVTRLAGPDRYSTSAAISAATFATGVPVAYVATGGNFPDALSGAPAAGVNRGPVLLVTPSSIPTTVQKELTRLAPKRIVILGGTGNVSTAVQTALNAYLR